MDKKIVLGTVVVKRTEGGAEIREVRLSDEAQRALSTAGAEIKLPAEISVRDLTKDV